MKQHVEQKERNSKSNKNNETIFFKNSKSNKKSETCQTRGVEQQVEQEE
jgi:hypothetical protein